MPEHHQNKPIQDEIDININNPRSPGSGNLVAICIIVGFLLLSGSVLYGFKALGKQLVRTNVAQNAGPDIQGQDLLPQQGQPAAEQAQIQDREDQPTLGNKDAKLTIYEFSDFQCPFCQRFYNETFKTIKAKYIDTGKAKLVFRHYPLPSHQNAQKAAEAAECASRQGKFEQYHDLLFEKGQADGTGLAVADLKKYADQLGLNKGTLGVNKNQFNECLDKGQAAETVRQDASKASAAGISGTPSFIINGQKIVGAQPTSVFEQAIEAALN